MDHNSTSTQRLERYRRQRRWGMDLGVLPLSYLHNEQVMSAWICGPHGWCDWNGRIGSSNYNIGKWPSDEEVTEDWEAIATAFPYLDLTAQCIDEEGEGVVAAQWRICNGTVVYDPDPPNERLTELLEMSPEDVQNRLFNPHAERGVTAERLISAFERVTGVMA